MNRADSSSPILQSFNTPILPSLESLFNELPLGAAMPDLVPRSTASKEALRLAAEAVSKTPEPALQAAIWLYVDDLDRSHALSQSIHDATGSFWHAIMHRREGDFGNSKYWLRQAGSHQVWSEIEGYEPFRFVDEVAAKHRENPAELVEMQRREWLALFEWCANSARGGQ